jgi:hypothetical protein
MKPDEMIGPNLCHECGEGYGLHHDRCSMAGEVANRRYAEKLREMAAEIGQKFLDLDIHGMTRARLKEEILRLRAAIRKHRDATGHDLCWYQPELWSLLPEPPPVHAGAAPSWAEFISRCAQYRASLEAIERLKRVGIK